MKLHERTKITRAAEQILLKAIIEVQKLDLTEAEYIQVVTTQLGNAITSATKFMIRDERHDNEDTPGDLDAPWENK
jgi:hypothetical protein